MNLERTSVAVTAAVLLRRFLSTIGPNTGVPTPMLQLLLKMRNRYHSKAAPCVHAMCSWQDRRYSTGHQIGRHRLRTDPQAATECLAQSHRIIVIHHD